MLRLTVVAFAALCLFGTSSLALAGPLSAQKADMKDAAKGEKGVSKSEGALSAQKAGPGGETGYEERDRMKGAKKQHKEKTKKHKDAAKEPAAPAPMSAPAPAPAP